MFVSKPLLGPFWKAPAPILLPPIGFGTILEFQDSLKDLFGQPFLTKGQTGGILGRALALTAIQNGPRPLRDPIFTEFGPMFDGLWYCFLKNPMPLVHNPQATHTQHTTPRHP